MREHPLICRHFYLPRRRRPGTGDIVTPPVRLSVCLSVRVAIFNIKKNIEQCPFTYWLNGRWFLQIVERDSWNLLSVISSIPGLVLILYLKCGGGLGGGVMFFSHFMLFPTFLEKKIWEYKTIISHLIFSSCFFLYAGNIVQLLVK